MRWNTMANYIDRIYGAQASGRCGRQIYYGNRDRLHFPGVFTHV